MKEKEISKLLKKYKSKIEKLKSKIKDLQKACKHENATDLPKGKDKKEHVCFVCEKKW